MKKWKDATPIWTTILLTLGLTLGATCAVQAADPLIFKAVDVPDVDGTFLFGINEVGQAVVQVGDASGNIQSFLREREGSVIPIAVPDAARTFPSGISNAGQIAGFFRLADGSIHGFIATPIPFFYCPAASD